MVIRLCRKRFLPRLLGLNVLELVLKQKEGLEEIQVVGRQIFEVRGGMAMPSPMSCLLCVN